MMLLLCDHVDGLCSNSNRNYKTCSGNLLRLQIFPNPVVEKVKVIYHTQKSNDAFLMVYDLFGKIVKTSAFNHAKSGLQSQSVDLSGLVPGIYFIQLSSGSTSERIMLNKISG